MGDRGGGREAKGSQLKKSKKNPGSTAAKVKKVATKGIAGPLTSLPPHPPDNEKPYFDCGCAILSRQFDRDRDKVCDRAKSEGVSGIVVWFSDVEKQSTLLDICKSERQCYCVIGVHPDNVDRTNKGKHEGWLEKVDESARKSECIGILSGLNLSREMATHFPQESLLRSSCQLAEKLLLPLILHVAPDGGSITRVIEILREEGWTNDSDVAIETSNDKTVLLHDAVTACGADVDKVSLVINAGFHCIVTASGIIDLPDDPVLRDKARQCIDSIPFDRLLSGTDAPWKTPQNLLDPYLRTLRNEPCNVGAIVEILSQVKNTPLNEMTILLKENAMRVFGMQSIQLDNNFPLTNSSLHSMEYSSSNSDSNTGKDDHDKAVSGADVGVINIHRSSIIKSSSDNNVSHNAKKKLSATQDANVGYYGCPKCRSTLFFKSDVTNHSLELARSTIFKVGEEGLCKTAIFLPAASANTYPGLVVRGNNALCKECDNKLGKYSAAESHCPCGIATPGPTIRVVAAKTDYFDNSLDTSALAARSLQEAERNMLLDCEIDDDGEDLNLNSRKSRKQGKKTKIVSANKGNFSNFRNKSFIPNASRSKKGDDDVEEEEEEDEDICIAPTIKKVS